MSSDFIVFVLVSSEQFNFLLSFTALPSHDNPSYPLLGLKTKSSLMINNRLSFIRFLMNRGAKYPPDPISLSDKIHSVYIVPYGQKPILPFP